MAVLRPRNKSLQSRDDSMTKRRRTTRKVTSHENPRKVQKPNHEVSSTSGKKQKGATSLPATSEADGLSSTSLPLIDLTVEGNPESLIRVVTKKIEVIDLTTDETPKQHLPPPPLPVPAPLPSFDFGGPPAVKRRVIDPKTYDKYSYIDGIAYSFMAPRLLLEKKDLNDAALPPPTLSKLGLSKAQWKDLEHATRSALPRFLFRGFTKRSGAGINPKLNSKHGVIPHGFLNGKHPTNIYDIPDLPDMINAHLSGGYHRQSDFSSWAADITVAQGFCSQGYPGRRLAVLDTSKLETHVRAYHVPSLMKAGLTRYIYPEEYLVYGPVRGAAYHCVRYAKLENAGITTLMTRSPPGSASPADFETSVEKAKQVARLICPASMRNPELFITLVVALSCGYPPLSGEACGQMLEAFLKHLSTDMKAVHLPSQGQKERHFGLVNRNTYAGGSNGGLWSTLEFLRRIEDAIRSDRAGAVGRGEGVEGWDARDFIVPLRVR
ncbi:hypothetical protein F5Y18DRAFT_430715 [Xylariaceae sp. FL1019]|nr:hypothetical protein F5Y18DRAFT_430715 [Xylariaceae sp. FL1019]